MPSSPPSFLPFGSIILNNGRYLLDVLANMLTTSKLSRSLAKPVLSSSIPLDIGLLTASPDGTIGDNTLEGALQNTTDLVGNSVLNVLNQTNRSRVLVFGSESFLRAKYLTERAFSGKPLLGLRDILLPNKTRDGKTKRPPRDGVYWTDDAEALLLCPVNFFDVILCFNVAGPSSHMTTLVKRLDRVLRPGGCFTGTGVFKGPTTAPEYDEDYETRVSLRAFRDCVEGSGFFMHTAMDMSLEGHVILKVTDETEEDPDEMVRSGELLCARFLATKHATTQPYRPHRRVVSVTAPELSSLSAVLSPTSAAELEAKLQEGLAQGLYSRSVEELARLDKEDALLRASLKNSLHLDGHYDTKMPELEAPVEAGVVDPQGVVVTGISLGLPNFDQPDRPVFDSRNFGSLFNGENFISELTREDKQSIIDMNVVQIVKKDGKRVEIPLSRDAEVIQVASKMGKFDLAREYGIPPFIVETLDSTYQLAIAAGIEALRDAGISLRPSESHGKTNALALPMHMQEETGVIFASSFPCMDSCVEEISKRTAGRIHRELLEELKGVQTQGKLEEYQYNRKLLFKLLVMANSQLAELVQARGPNTQINSACSGTSQAIAMAEDWIRSGRCKRVIVVSADNPTSESVLPYIGTGFLALGAATIVPGVENAAVPFDLRRKGMILGAGAVGLVLESTGSAVTRNAPIKTEVLGSVMKNSAFHASLMDKDHIASEFGHFIDRMENEYGLDRRELAKDCIYYSHETCTGVCAKIEAAALEKAFGQSRADILIANTKGFTGHPMAVGVEDVMAVASLAQGLVPPIANYREPDPSLGDIQLSRGGSHTRRYAMRFAAGFGSQFTILMFRKWEKDAPLPQARKLSSPSTSKCSPPQVARKLKRRKSPSHLPIPIIVRVTSAQPAQPVAAPPARPTVLGGSRQ
jgi:3-oxoacyl-(acyl-carrier-protein) synthase